MIFGQRRGFSDIFFGCPGREELQTDRPEQTQAESGSEGRAIERDDRHPHPESITGRRMTIKGKCIQADINAFILPQVLKVSHPPSDFNPVTAEPKKLKLTQVVVSNILVIPFLESQYKSRFVIGFQDFGPKRHDRRDIADSQGAIRIRNVIVDNFHAIHRRVNLSPAFVLVKNHLWVNVRQMTEIEQHMGMDI